MKIDIAKHNDWTILELEGDFSIKSLVGVRTLLDKFTQNQVRKVAIDLALVTFIDSSAIGLMANYTKQMAKRKGRFAVFNAQSDILQILNMVSFEKATPVFASRKEFEDQAD